MLYAQRGITTYTRIFHKRKTCFKSASSDSTNKTRSVGNTRFYCALPPNAFRVQKRDGGQVTFIGITEDVPRVAEQVRKLIEITKPDVVAVQRSPRTHADPNVAVDSLLSFVGKGIRWPTSGKNNHPCLNYEEFLTRNVSMVVGNEYKAAWEAAKSVKAEFIRCDLPREFVETVRDHLPTDSFVRYSFGRYIEELYGETYDVATLFKDPQKYFKAIKGIRNGPHPDVERAFNMDNLFCLNSNYNFTDYEFPLYKIVHRPLFDLNGKLNLNIFLPARVPPIDAISELVDKRALYFVNKIKSTSGKHIVAVVGLLHLQAIKENWDTAQFEQSVEELGVTEDFLDADYNIDNWLDQMVELKCALKDAPLGVKYAFDVDGWRKELEKSYTSYLEKGPRWWAVSIRPRFRGTRSD